jgi:DNA-binding NarL/FixJ family response regulator
MSGNRSGGRPRPRDVASHGARGRDSSAVAARVLIADGQALARAGLRTILEDAGFDVVAEAADGQAAVRAALEEIPDLCLLDIRMPGGAIGAAAQINRRLPATRIVVINASCNDPQLFAAVEAGATGYLLDDLEPRALAGELERVLHGEASLCPALAHRLMEEFRRRQRRGWAPLAVELTGREWEVLELMRERLGTADIGRRLHIAPATVRRHAGAILKKLNVPTREAALKLTESSSESDRYAARA